MESNIETPKSINDASQVTKDKFGATKSIEKESATKMFVRLNNFTTPSIEVNVEEHKEESDENLIREADNSKVKEDVMDMEVDSLDMKREDYNTENKVGVAEAKLSESKQELQSTGISLKEVTRNGSMYRASSVLLSFDVNSSSSPSLSLADAFRRQKKSIIERAERKHSMKSEQRPEQRVLRSTKTNLRTLERSVSRSKSSELVNRLASGKRIRIKKEEMKMITERRYQQLPEVVKKREQEKRRQEMLERIQITKLNRKVTLRGITNRKG